MCHASSLPLTTNQPILDRLFGTNRSGQAAGRADDRRQAYFGGEAITVADICVTAIVVIARVIDVRTDHLPIITDAVTRCESLSAFAESAPLRQPGAPSD